MINERKTPRTDIACKQANRFKERFLYILNFARELEIELEIENARLKGRLEEAKQTEQRLRGFLRDSGYCDCPDPSQCWESCGTLGHSAIHAVRASPEQEAAVNAALSTQAPTEEREG